jgi:hypothetical protein
MCSSNFDPTNHLKPPGADRDAPRFPRSGAARTQQRFQDFGGGVNAFCRNAAGAFTLSAVRRTAAQQGDKQWDGFDLAPSGP